MAFKSKPRPRRIYTTWEQRVENCRRIMNDKNLPHDVRKEARDIVIKSACKWGGNKEVKPGWAYNKTSHGRTMEGNR